MAITISGCGSKVRSTAFLGLDTAPRPCSNRSCFYSPLQTLRQCTLSLPFNTQSAACLQLPAQLLQVRLAVITSLVGLYFVSDPCGSRYKLLPAGGTAVTEQGSTSRTAVREVSSWLCLVFFFITISVLILSASAWSCWELLISCLKVIPRMAVAFPLH